MPTQHRPHPGDQLARVERLAEIIVGADLKADDAVDVFFQRGQENDGHVRALGAQIPADIEPRPVREHDIEHDEIDLVRRQPLVQLVAACREQHAEALTLDIAGEKLADLRIVVCDKNSLLRAHRTHFYRRAVAATRPFL